MAFNQYPGKSVKWLLERRDAIIDYQDTGGITKLAILGLDTERAGASKIDYTERLKQICYSLHLLDPDTYPNPLTQKVMKISSVY